MRKRVRLRRERERETKMKSKKKELTLHSQGPGEVSDERPPRRGLVLGPDVEEHVGEGRRVDLEKEWVLCGGREREAFEVREQRGAGG